ncbi:Hypothetical predicted protein [Mytilus galloprovincialis]|uniref:Uncharacterized protein n=1 Tax=Mytilus galloprovincialis TaxID=29158 RepID=A0A8B6D238_MYTGA|nr:Hypothetical predicted protein [Mytilus galloprovincialis]
MSHMDRRSEYNQNTGNNVKNSAINSVNNVNRDDMYLSQGHSNMQMSRQRSRSTDGILLDDTDLSSAHQMKLKLKDPSSMQRSGTPSSPRNSQNHSVPFRVNEKANITIWKFKEQHIQGPEVIPRTDRNLQSTPIQDKSREDNSSNPDSGYSSKIYGRNLNSGNAPSTSCTPSSSFSTEPTDHNITLSSNNSPHPQVNHSDYAQINSVQQQYQKDLSSHVQHWYQRKLKDAAKNLNDGEYGYHSDYHSPTNGIQNSNDFSQYEYAQQSRQPVYHGNQTYSSYHQVPNFIRGSDV